MFTPRPLRRPRGAHAAPRGGDIPMPASTPPPSDRVVVQEPPAAASALGSVASGNYRVAVSYLTALSDGELAAAVVAARGLADLAAAVARTRQRDPQAPPPAGFRLCLGCLIGDVPACGDPGCAGYPRPRREPAQAAAGAEEAAVPGSGDRSGCD
jgi:hypothetical protein